MRYIPFLLIVTIITSCIATKQKIKPTPQPQVKKVPSRKTDAIQYLVDLNATHLFKGISIIERWEDSLIFPDPYFNDSIMQCSFRFLCKNNADSTRQLAYQYNKKFLPELKKIFHVPGLDSVSGYILWLYPLTNDTLIPVLNFNIKSH